MARLPSTSRVDRRSSEQRLQPGQSLLITLQRDHQIEAHEFIDHPIGVKRLRNRRQQQTRSRAITIPHSQKRHESALNEACVTEALPLGSTNGRAIHVLGCRVTESGEFGSVGNDAYSYALYCIEEDTIFKEAGACDNPESDMERPCQTSSLVTAGYCFSMRSCSVSLFDGERNAASEVAESAVATVDHSDIRGSEPHNRDPSGAASD